MPVNLISKENRFAQVCAQSHLYFVVLTHISLYQRLVLKFVIYAGVKTRSCNVSQRCPGLQ